MSFYSRLAAYYACDTTHGRSLGEDSVGANDTTSGVATSGTGKVREGITFLASSSQFRSAPNDAVLQQLKGVCLWVKFTTVAADQTILSKGSDATDANTSIKLWFDQSEDGIAYTVGDGASATTVTTSNQSISSDTWYHVHAWNDGNRIGIAINGTLRGSGTARTPLVETGLLYLGSAFGGGTYLDGMLDEVALFSTSPSLSDGAAHYNGGDGASLPLDDALPGTGGKAGHTDPWTPPSFARSDDATLYMAQGKLPVQRFDGVLARAGVEAPSTAVTIGTSGAGRIKGSFYAYVRFLDARGSASSLSPLSDVHVAAGTGGGLITGASNATPIVITSAFHGLATGAEVTITGQLGNTAANGTWGITRVDADSFQLNGSVGNGDWSASENVDARISTQRGGQSPTNEIQSISFSGTPSGGTFTVTHEAITSAAISATATASVVQAALQAMSSVGSGNVTCAGGPMGTAAVTATFVGNLAATDVALMTGDATNTLGESIDVNIATTQEGDSGTNEQQTIDLLNSPTGGTFTLTYSGQTTSGIAYNASAATVDAALEALSNIGAGDVTCTGGPLPGTLVTVEFTGTLAATAVDEMTADPSSLTGTGVSMAVSTTVAGTSGLDSGLACYYNLEESAVGPWQDQIDNASNELTAGGSGPISSVTGVQGNGIRLGDTLAHKFLTETTPSADLRNTDTDFTVAGWVAFSGSGVPDRPALFSVYISPLSLGTAPLAVALSGSDIPTFHMRSDSLAASTHGAVTTGTFYFLACRYTTSTKLAEISVNGGAWDSATFTQFTASNNGTHFLMGAVTGGLTDHIDLDEWAKWNRKLSDAEVTSLYNSGAGKTYPMGGGTAETQRITTTGTPTEGTFTLTFQGQTTDDIAYNASAATIDTALEALSNVNSGDLTTTGGPLPGSTVDVQFPLASGDVDEMTVDGNGLLRTLTTTANGSPSQNEIQTVTAASTPLSGTYTLTFDGETTTALDHDSTAAEVDAALEALSNLGAGDVTCTGGPLNTTAVTVEFTGTEAAANQNAMTTTSSLVGATPTLTISESTQGVGSLNEIQDVVVSGVTAGAFTLTYSGQTTASISFDATATDVQAALEALSNISVGDVSVTGGPLTEARLSVEFTGTLAATDVGEMTTGSSSLRNGGWSIGAGKVTYSGVDVPTSINVTRRQVLRSKPGASSVFYIDVDTTDVASTEFSSTNTDDDLTSDLAVVLKDADGQDVNLSRHGEPPDWKRSVTSFQNRLFYAVDYVEKPFVTVSGDTATGVATDWPNVFDSRTFYGDGEVAVGDIDPDTQTAALTENTLSASSTPTELTLRTAHPDSQRVYSSHVTATETLAESVNLGEPFTLSLNERDGEMTGQFTFDGGLYEAFDNSIYKYTFQTNPNQFPSGDGRMQLVASRGLLNNRCVAYVDDVTYIMDRQGVYVFEGNEVQPVNEVVKTFFTGRDSDVIKWRHQDNFHAAFFPQQRTCRFFIVLDGGPYTRHALCHNVDQGYWWVEEYPWPITASCTGTIDGKTHVFLGSTGRKVFTLSEYLEGVRSSNDTLRGTATSAGFRTIADTAATFSASLVGLKCRIIEGTGFGQTREITAVSGTTLTLMTPWNVRPSTDSVYQIAGISWKCRTGKLRYAQSNERSPRNVQVRWEPNTLDQLLSFSMYEDWSGTAIVPEVTMSEDDTDGVRITKDSPRFEVPLTNARGHVSTGKAGMSQAGITGDEFLAVELQGTTNQEPVKIHGIAVGGVS